MNRYRIFIALLLVAGSVTASAEQGCNIYPEDVPTGYSDCILRDAGEKPLWRGGLKRGVVQEVRFTFTEGHLAYVKVIHFTQWANGKARIWLKTLRRARNGDMILVREKGRRLSAQEVAMIDQLGASSGTWELPIGSWDGDDLFMHCETLDMERATPDSYSFATVSISCNQPRRLMPFVTFITGLVGLKAYADRQMF